MPGKQAGPGPRKRNRIRNVQPRHRDSYVRRAKPRATVLCTGCGLTLSRGRWQWKARLGEVRAGLCPACERVRDRYPAGTLTLDEAFLERREELLGMIRNVEALERAEHPLERVMELGESDGRLVVTTTGLHLPRMLAQRLARAFHRKPRIRYLPEEASIRVDWEPLEGSARTRAAGPSKRSRRA